MAKKSQKKFKTFEVPELSNACQTLLANIRFASVEEDIKTIVVTSTVPDEGKTTVSSNLALAIASSGKRVLLVDADLRRRCLGGLLGVHPAYGVHALLSGRATIEEAVVETSYDNLMFLDCEPNIPNPPDILSTKRFTSMVKSLEESFDYVIFDAPPVGVFIDAAIIGSVVDGALLVVRERRTKREEVATAAQQMKAANARILGVVMTFSHAEDNNYYYAYYNERGQRASKSKTKAAKREAASVSARSNTTHRSSKGTARSAQEAQTIVPASTVRPIQPAARNTGSSSRTSTKNPRNHGNYRGLGQ